MFGFFSEMGDHLVKHGDGVKDIAFTVEDCDLLVQVILKVSFCRCILSYLVTLHSLFRLHLIAGNERYWMNAFAFNALTFSLFPESP